MVAQVIGLQEGFLTGGILDVFPKAENPIAI